MDQKLERYRSVMADSSRWDGFEFRGDDIVISTPSKCGTTWMQMMCALLVFQDPSLPRPLTELSPWLDVQTATVASVFAALEAQKHRRFIKTHTPFDGLPYDERVTYVCVGRDPRDVAVSWDNHSNNMNLDVVIGARASAVGLDDLPELLPDGLPPRSDLPVDRFWAWVDNNAPPSETPRGLQGTLHHLGTFWRSRESSKVALFHFSDMQADLDREMRRLASVLMIEIDEDRWPALVSAATFDRMRDRAQELAPQVGIAGFWHDPTRFFNEGSSGQWRSFIDTDELAERYKRRVREIATPDLAAWAHGGWQGRDAWRAVARP